MPFFSSLTGFNGSKYKGHLLDIFPIYMCVCARAMFAARIYPLVDQANYLLFILQIIKSEKSTTN